MRPRWRAATYTATIEYANVSWSGANVNPSANVALNILANGVVVGTGTLSGLAQDSPWTPVTATWTADRAYAGQAIQLQVVATNFLEGPGSTQQWQVPTFGFANATLTAAVPITVPAAPSGLTATAASSSQINLSWTNNATNQSGFQIDQATSSDFHPGPDHGDGWRQRDHLQRHRSVGQYHVLLPRAGHQLRRRFGQLLHGERHDRLPGAPVAITVPDGNFTRIHLPTTLTRVGTGGTYTAPMTVTLSGWNIKCQPEHGPRADTIRGRKTRTVWSTMSPAAAAKLPRVHQRGRNWQSAGLDLSTRSSITPENSITTAA